MASSYRGFTIALRHIPLGRTPLVEWSARHRGLYLTTSSTHKKTDIHAPAGFEPAIPASEKPQTARRLGSAIYIDVITYVVSIALGAPNVFIHINKQERYADQVSSLSEWDILVVCSRRCLDVALFIGLVTDIRYGCGIILITFG